MKLRLCVDFVHSGFEAVAGLSENMAGLRIFLCPYTQITLPPKTLKKCPHGQILETTNYNIYTINIIN